MSDGVAGGRLVDDRFRLITPLGRGHAGQVWQAVDEQTGRPVAVKLHRGRPGWDPAAGVSHPCVVSILFLGTDEGAAYTVMELVDGVSLATVLEEGMVPADDAVTIALGVCDALHAAHTAGVTHGNLKPSNVLIADGGRGHPVVKVGDFTGHGDPREDMYSLGLLMEAMSGRRDPVVERLLSRDPYTPAQLRAVLTSSARSPQDPEPDHGPDREAVRGLEADRGLDREADPDRPRLVRLAVITGVVTLAVVIAACAWFVKPSPPPDIGSAAPSGGRSPSAAGQATGPSAAPSTSEPAAAAPGAPAGGPSVEAVNAVKSVIANQLKAGNIQQGAASSLTSRLDDIARFQSRGQTKQANDRIVSFKNQLASLRRADRVNSAGYDAILASVNELSG